LEIATIQPSIASSCWKRLYAILEMQIVSIAGEARRCAASFLRYAI
jgi:hypothetical protein